MGTTVWGIHNVQPTIDPVAEKGVRISYNFDSDLSQFPTRDSLRKEYDRYFPKKSGGAKAQEVGVLYRFSHEIQPGDVVVAPNRQDSTISIGVVNGAYRYLDEESSYRHFLPVEWKHTKLPRSRFSPSTLNTLGSAVALFKVDNGREEILDILYGTDPALRQPIFDWIPFYEELSDTILTFRSDRVGLMDKIAECARICGTPRLFDYLIPKVDTYGTNGRLHDIDPFTALSPFNRNITTKNRLKITEAYKRVFQIQSPAPTGFDGIPVVNNMASWFMHFPDDGSESNVEALWDLAVTATEFAENDSTENQERLVSAFDAARRNSTVRLTMGLFYIRPRTFPAFDQQNVKFLRERFPRAQDLVLKTVLVGDEYLANVQAITQWLEQDSTSPSSIAEFSHEAYVYEPDASAIVVEDSTTENIDSAYDVSQIIDDGCFLPEERLNAMLRRLESKKNIILQGPPGTGKTWLARRLAWAFMREKNPESLLVMQFHPSMSYEDFVRGYRPSSSGGLELVDGPFLSFTEKALADPHTPYVIIIEEINRGNPAQIFGEMLTLMENTKRSEAHAMRLIYPRGEEKFYLPENLHIIGTMNLADRSLALVDMAFRRRFAFENLKPEIGDQWLEFTAQQGYNRDVLSQFADAFVRLNDDIAEDSLLGPHYRIGHSYLVPRLKATEPDSAEETRSWLLDVVTTEILPLVEEYWFDQPSKVKSVVSSLRNAL
ncbi:AAA family ATPase [Corynebacterium cystitidis]|uniref:AAA family ATPase n=1 Tax=Corynebacterium cystitidis TaxID=35757 RepID=UPI00211DAD07|nr:AAA family ATPase [Corynebacterium cystitidis]